MRRRLVESVIAAVSLLLFLGTCAAALACNSNSELKGGLLVTFDVTGERYSVLIKNPDTIEQVLALERGESSAAIPNGRLVKGQVSYNQPWSWHIDPQDIAMSDFTIELYDGLPSHVEGDLDYWLETVGRFAPWQATIVSIEDYR